MMQPLTHNLERTVVIRATPETVFRFFTDSARWAKWWGAGSTIDPRPGGNVFIRYPNGVEALGEVIEAVPPERIVFTYGYGSGQPIPPGSSRVTIRLTPHAEGTRLNLLHEFAGANVRDAHVQGWRFQLSLFGNAVADEVHASASGLVDAWFEAWAIADDKEREAALGRIASADIQFRDRFSLLESLADLTAHIAAAQRHMKDVRLRRQGEIRHCQAMVLADWTAQSPDGRELMRGTNVFALSPDGRITSVTGFAQ